MMRPALVVAAVGLVAAASILAWRGAFGPGAGSSGDAPRDASPALASAAGDSREAAASRRLVPRPYDPAWDAGGGDERRIVIAGRVLDGRRRPAANAAVVMKLAGRDAGSARPGADGRFRIDGGAHPADGVVDGMLEATGAHGGIDVQFFQARPDDELPEPTLVLEDGGSIAVRVLENGEAVSDARVFFGHVSSLGYGPFPTDARGMLGPRRIPAGSYLVTAFRGDAARGDALVVVGRNEERSVDVTLAPAWRLLVTVRDSVTGRPVPGTELVACSTIGDQFASLQFEVAVQAPLSRTDAAGQGVLAGLSPLRAVTVAGMPRGLAWFRRMMLLIDAQKATAEPGTPELVLRVSAEGATHAFPIVADEVAGPPDGALVKLGPPPFWGGVPPPPEGRVVGRTLVVDHLSEVCREFLATAEDGSMALLKIEDGADAKFKRPRTLAVSARDRTGVPLAGCVVELRSRGTNENCRSVTLGADGTARIGGLYPNRVNVCLIRRGEIGITKVGDADLEEASESRVDLIVEPAETCLVRVTVDGEKRLPPRYSISTQGASIDSVDEDAEEAILRLNLRRKPAAESFGIYVEAPGHPPSSVVFTDRPDGGPSEGVLAFVTGAKARIRVLPADDDVHDAVLEREGEGNSWHPARDHVPAGDVGRKPRELMYEGLSPDVYRARDVPTGLVSESIELAAGASADFTLDLRKAGPVTIRLEGPPDAEPTDASIQVVGSGVDRPGQLRGIGDAARVVVNSEVKIRVPGDRPVTLRAIHSELVPSPGSEAVRLTAPGTPVVFKYVRGRRAGVWTEAPHEGAGRVLLFAGEVGGDPVRSCPVTFTEPDRGQFDGYPTGTYSLWFDVPPWAPFVMEDRELGGEGTQWLGRIDSLAGASLRIRIQVAEGQAVPRIEVTATCTGPPSYSRVGSLAAGGGDEVVVRGLGPGRFRVEIRKGDGDGAPVMRDVVSDGSGEIPLVLDLR